MHTQIQKLFCSQKPDLNAQTQIWNGEFKHELNTNFNLAKPNLSLKYILFQRYV